MVNVEEKILSILRWEDQNHQDGVLVRYKGLVMKTFFQGIFDSNKTKARVESLVRFESLSGVKLSPLAIYESKVICKDDLMEIDILAFFLHVLNFSFIKRNDSALKLHVNLLPDTFLNHSSFFQKGKVFFNVLRSLDLSVDDLIIEIVEKETYSEANLMGKVKCFSSLGVQFAIDDFGTGFSNIARSKALTPEVLKLDKKLLINYMTGNCRPLIDAVELARSIKAKVVVEGVENEDELNCMQFLGIDMFQGFYLERPYEAKFSS